MTSPASLTYVTLVADADTPAEWVPYNGRIVGLRPDDLALLGSGPGNPGTLFTVHGYIVAGSGPPQFLMTPLISPAAVNAIKNIPSTGWLVPASQTTYRQAGVQLVRDFGVAPATALNVLTNLYNAAVANYVASL